VVEIVAQRGLPDAEVEVVHGQDQVLEEGGTLKCYNRAVAALALVDLSDILSKLGSFFGISCTGRWLDAPVNLDKVTFV
jgi:hypothetical protein